MSKSELIRVIDEARNHSGFSYSYDVVENCYLIYRNPIECGQFKHSPYDQNLEVVAKGFTAFITSKQNNPGEINAEELYKEYFSWSLGLYVKSAKQEPDSFIRDLDLEFVPKHIISEKRLLMESENFLSIDTEYLKFHEYGKVKVNVQRFAKFYIQWVAAKDRSRLENKEDLKKYLYPDKIAVFLEIEDELLARSLIDETGIWGLDKKVLLDLIFILESKEFFKKIARGGEKKSFKYRQFLSNRYGFGKTGLTGMAGKHKPTMKLAMASFPWINHFIS